MTCLILRNKWYGELCKNGCTNQDAVCDEDSGGLKEPCNEDGRDTASKVARQPSSKKHSRHVDRPKVTDSERPVALCIVGTLAMQ